jgi:hypothetical protein
MVKINYKFRDKLQSFKKYLGLMLLPGDRKRQLIYPNSLFNTFYLKG